MQSRRGFLAGAGGLAFAAVFRGPQTLAAERPPSRPTLRGGRFAEGVMSGDPSPHAITLWTRVSDAEGSGTVELEVARDRGFRRVVARDTIRASGASAWSVKARVGGLRAHEEYWYRFSTRGGESSVGRFRTALPPDSREPVRFAFFSCQEYTVGYFNAHVLLADEELDFVVNLGDYIYADVPFAPGDAFGAVRSDSVGYAQTIEQYRAKYALYRSEAALRRMHARFPMISIWDDHEVVDNYAGGAGPTGGLSPDRRYSEERRAVAYRAFFESMPSFGTSRGGTRIHRALRFGRVVDLILLDQRQYRADQPCGDAFNAPPCAEVARPRALLGRRQMRFVKKRLESSPAAWKVLANSVMMMPTIYPGGNYGTFDSWQGYPQERRELLEHVRRKDVTGVVFATGDSHSFVAGEVRVHDEDRRPVATEFVGGSITSLTLGDAGAGAIIDALRSANSWGADADFDHHGYGLAEASQDGFKCTMRRVDTVKARSRIALPKGRFSYRIGLNEPGLPG